MKSLKQILQRMGWAEDQAVNFIEKAGGATPVGLPADTSSLLYHVRKLQDELSLHIDGSTEEDTTATEPEPTEGIGVWRGHEPAGYTQITHDDFDNENGEWSYQNGSGTYSLTTRADEPDVDGHGADGVYRTHYPEGLSDGSDAANAWRAGIDGDVAEFYVAYTFRLQEGWLNNTNETKHLVWFWGGEIGGTLDFDPDNGADGLLFPVVQTKDPETGTTQRVTPESSGFTREHAEVTRGVWHQAELQVVGNTSNANKTIRVWIDGVLVLEETVTDDVTEGPHAGGFLKEVKYGNTYGGGGQSVPQDQHIDVGHVYVSGVA